MSLEEYKKIRAVMEFNSRPTQGNKYAEEAGNGDGHSEGHGSDEGPKIATATLSAVTASASAGSVSTLRHDGAKSFGDFFGKKASRK
jgi:hypothetical protein